MQKDIGRQSNGMAAKKRAYRPDNPPVRPDWNRIKKYAMMAALATKLQQHPDAFAAALMETSGRLCAEVSYRDFYWGAKPRQDGSYTGRNVLGRMLTKLRRKLEQADGDADQAAHAFLERHTGRSRGTADHQRPRPVDRNVRGGKRRVKAK